MCHVTKGNQWTTFSCFGTSLHYQRISNLGNHKWAEHHAFQLRLEELEPLVVIAVSCREAVERSGTLLLVLSCAQPSRDILAVLLPFVCLSVSYFSFCRSLYLCMWKAVVKYMLGTYCNNIIKYSDRFMDNRWSRSCQVSPALPVAFSM